MDIASGQKAWMMAAMITVTMPELQRRVHRFEVGEAKLEQLGQTPFAKDPGQQQALEHDLKAIRKELADMRILYQQGLADGAG